MHLLEQIENGELSLTHFVGDCVPPYAILSHRWESEEVTFQDILNHTYAEKEGYAKIRACGEQANKDGLRYFWIDTLCIDRSSSAELTEAINSMFRWFAQAEKCYVYLSDVYDHDSDFRNSSWFHRGWTLQELIAPRRVEFYSREWTCIGNKADLAPIIRQITGIPIEVLNYSKRPDEYSVPERMAWASSRSTARIEDRAYCLMGLFGINMPVIYGEGELAFQRLQKEIMALTNQISGLRLLVVDSSPLAIETFASQNAPDYAILSHTWSTNEVSFQDILIGKAPERRGYQKIKNCCEQAARHGFKYLWVDTCCIDKTSSAELQEAICSMYKWYQNAKLCYVYLEDYEARSNSPSQLASCKWFKRGWTLQELIAPSSVKFYDSSWNEFGTKASLCQQIADITRISPMVLRGENPTRRTVAERMIWASGRSTSRIEDVAYSLMGLFDVFMPMLYGEGDRAFMRLQEEIMKKSEDYTIFAWTCARPETYQHGLFARCPDEFIRPEIGYLNMSDSLGLLSPYMKPNQQFYSPAAMTSRGLLISLPLLTKDAVSVSRARGRGFASLRHFQSSSEVSQLRPGTYLALICRISFRNGHESQLLCISLRKYSERGVFIRFSPESVTLLPEKRAADFNIHTIYASTSGVL